MNRKSYLAAIDGIFVEQVIRNQEYSMYSRHFHESFELYFLMEGERYYFIDQETYLVKSGMVVLVSRNQIHKTSVAGSPYHDRILLQLDGPVLNPYMKLFGLPSMEELFAANYGVLELGEEEWKQAVDVLEEIKLALAEKRKQYEEMATLKTLELMLLIYRNRQEKREETNWLPIPSRESKKSDTPKHQKVHETAEYLLTHCESEETLEELAARFYVSKSYLSRIFREVTGFTINEYRNLNRIKKAQRLLKETDLPVTAIAEQTGFDSITYFEKVFKKHADSTPLTYRKNHKFPAKLAK